jgi:putative ABC transport system ATP-binding protein
MSEPLIVIRDLRYRYAGAEEDVLRIPSLNVSGSGLIAITGPSGAGKTTLVELLAGTLQEPYEGTVQVLGTDWKALRRDGDRQRQLRRIGLIPQDFGLLPSWTPQRTLEQDLSDAEVPTAQREERVRRSLEQVGLSEFAEREIGALSGGQHQRVAIARMLARDVELVIADEPTANLDPQLVEEIGGLLKTLAAKVPVIVVTHDPRMAEICDRTIVLQAAAPQASSAGAEIPNKVGKPLRRRVALWVVAVVLLAAAIGSALLLTHKAGSTSANATPAAQATPTAKAPAPDFATFLPKNYHVVKVIDVAMDGGAVPDAVVLSAGPPSPRVAGFASDQQDVQILAWDPVAKRWNVAFDARTVPAMVGVTASATNSWPFVSPDSGSWSPASVLPKDLADQVAQFQTADLGPGVGEVLAFTADVNAGANSPSELVIVGFEQGAPQVEYEWFGDDMPVFDLSGPAAERRIRVKAALFTPVDSMSTPARAYQFVLAAPQGQVNVVSDNRPWLGVAVSAVNPSSASSPLQITRVVSGSPAAGVLQRGDVILSVDGQPIPHGGQYPLGPTMIDQLEKLHAGDNVTLEIDRQGQDEPVEIELGSVLDSSTQGAYAPNNQSTVIVL